jgi:hypothetical protein
MILEIVAIFGAVSSSVFIILKYGLEFYWKVLDRRLTNIQNRSNWFRENYEGSTIDAEFVRGTISYVRCYHSKNRLQRSFRYLAIDTGRTEITIVFSTSIDNRLWDYMEDTIEERGAKVLNYNQNCPHSSIKLKINSFELEEVEEICNYVVQAADEAVKENSS